MSKTDAALHPGEFFIFRRYKAEGHWDPLYRDNDLETMRLRFDYQVEHLNPGEGVRLYAPDTTLMLEATK